VDFCDDVMYGHDADFRLEEIEIAATSDLGGKTLRQTALHETTGALLIAIRSKQASSCPTHRRTPRWKRAWYSSPPEHSPSSEHSTTVPKAFHSHTQAHGAAAAAPRTADRTLDITPANSPDRFWTDRKMQRWRLGFR
jgi:hypothetical protein